MKRFIPFLLVSALATAAAHAQVTPRPALEDRGRAAENLIYRSGQVNQLIYQRAYQLRPSQVQRIDMLLAQIEDIALNRFPNPQPYPPAPPMPVPPRPIPIVMCANDNPDLMRDTFVKIKAFAYASDGLNYTSVDAGNFAQNWINTRPCAEADGYIRTIKTLRAFAYDSSGLNMTSVDAAKYALTMVDRRCLPEGEYVVEFKKLYDFAYSSSGLNYTSNDARNYARAEIEKKYFSCGTVVPR